MLYFRAKLDRDGTFGPVNQVTDAHQNDMGVRGDGWGWYDHTDLKTFAQAESLAKAANEAGGYDGSTLIAVDRGSHVSPRYDVIRLPAVGDEVSYSFNGDTYPCGKVTSISKTLKVIRTDSGRDFYRRGESGSWVNEGTWSLVRGHHYEQNPSF